MSDTSPQDQQPSWTHDFTTLYKEAVNRYHAGVRSPDELFRDEEREYLSAIGATAQEIYDFVEDWCDYGEPSIDTVVAMTAVRREYFLTVQNAQPSRRFIGMSELPSPYETLGGYKWLPRIIAKAQAKLRGEMPPELMYGCGGDRPFLRRIGIEPAEFLRLVWRADGNTQEIVDAVNARMDSAS